MTQKLLVALLVAVFGAAIGAGSLWFTVRDRLAAPSESESDTAPDDQTPQVAHTESGGVLIRMDRQTQQRVGLQVQPLAAVEHQPELAARGVLQEDPQGVFTLRAPLAGVIIAVDSQWPDIGRQVAAGDTVGFLEPRLSPTEQIDLATRLTQARADVSEAEAGLSAARASYESKKKLNAEGKAVSDRAVEEAEAKLKSEEARLEAARQIMKLIENAQAGTGHATTRLPLRADRAGEVVESPVQPGEAVEPGQVLLRIVNFRTLVARVEIPVGTAFDPAVHTARIVPVGREDLAMEGAQMGLGTSVASAERGAVLLFRVTIGDRPLRPGLPVMAYLPMSGGARHGVIIPRSAIVRFQGDEYAYVQVDDEAFVRRALKDAEPIDHGWFTTEGFSPGDRLVVEGAQMLLSEEQKQQIEQEETATE